MLSPVPGFCSSKFYGPGIPYGNHSKTSAEAEPEMMFTTMPEILRGVCFP